MGHLVTRWRRTGTTAAAGVLVTASVLVLVGSSAEVAAAPTVESGDAKATAILTEVAPGVGSLKLGMTVGVAVSQTTNALSQAQGQASDLGLIGTSLTAEGCDGGDPTVSPSQLPQPLRVDNRKGDVSETRDELPFGPFGGGRLAAAATTKPASNASASGFGLDIPGFLNLGGGKSSAETELLPGVGREARAAVEGNLDIGGIVKLSGMRWSARHRTGPDIPVEAEAAFDVGRATIGGLPFPSSDADTLEAAVNTALAPSGVSIDFPDVEHVTEPQDLVRATPMTILLKDSPAGSAVLGPVLNLTRAQREQLFDELAAQFCDAASALFVGDIGVSVIGGTGFLAINIGGAEALSSNLVFVDPFGTVEPFTPVQDVIDAIGGVAPTTPARRVGGTPAVAGTPDIPGTVIPGRPAANIGPLEKVCESVHPFQWPDCSKGSAAVVGFLGLLATLGVGALDFRRHRKLLGGPDPVVAAGAAS
jgi:hypothetical protein